MTRWKKRNINLGSINVKDKKKIIIQGITNIPEIKSLWSSCKCSKPIYKKDKKQIIVYYTPANIPEHLKYRGWYETKKKFGILYLDGSQDIFSFKAKIYKNKI